MLHSLSSAIALLSGAENRANMPFTSRSLVAVFLIDNFCGYRMWLRSAWRLHPLEFLPMHECVTL
eukprot:3253202-Ditylum_brightwellii.AAC.1